MSGVAVRSTSDSDSARQALATLISSTRSKRRPVSIPEIAKSLSIALAHFGSLKAVADRVGVSAKMLGQFAAVNHFTKQVKNLFKTASRQRGRRSTSGNASPRPEGSSTSSRDEGIGHNGRARCRRVAPSTKTGRYPKSDREGAKNKDAAALCDRVCRSRHKGPESSGPQVKEVLESVRDHQTRTGWPVWASRGVRVREERA